MSGKKFVYRLTCEKISLKDIQNVVTFGIRVKKSTGTGIVAAAEIPDISLNRVFVEHIRHCLEENQAEPIHFRLLVDDFLAREWEWIQENDVRL